MKSHRVFAALYDALTGPLEQAVLAPRRAALLGELTGEVLEIGAGTGASLGHYLKASRIVAAEPDPAMRARLARALERCAVPVQLSSAAAENLPFPAAHFDAVVSVCVLCSVRDPQRALAEAHRVLKPGGRLVVLEHVRGRGRLADWQDRITPLWSRLVGGCHPNRDLHSAIERAGFSFEYFEESDPMPKWVPTRPMLEATARSSLLATRAARRPGDSTGDDSLAVGLPADRELMDWLLDSDPALRWQVLADLTDVPASKVAAERARVATEGWGARLLASCDEDGQWAGGACFPRGFHGDFSQGQPWTSTLPTLVLLRELGINPAAGPVRRIIDLVRLNCRWEHAGQAFFDGEVEPCINGRVVALGAYFGVPVDSVVTRLLGEQLADGGWNCEAENGSVRSSFHTTICVLEGLLAYERATGGTPETMAARHRGEEYLLERRLFRRLSTGEVADGDWLRFSFPTQWHYDVLRGLDHFRAAGHKPDPRLAEAVTLVREKRRPSGAWLLENTHRGAVHFTMEDGDGAPSRWNTLRALRVLNWYDGEHSKPSAAPAH